MIGCGRFSFEPRARPDGGLDGALTGCQMHPAQQVSDADANTVALAWTGDGYLVAWIDGLGQGLYSVHTRQLDRWGVPVSPATLASIGGVTGYTGTDVASLQATTGGYAIAYSSQRQSRYQVYMNALALDGTQVGGDGQLTSANVESRPTLRTRSSPCSVTTLSGDIEVWIVPGLSLAGAGLHARSVAIASS
jgi:YD repeat-containing protein